MRPLLFFLIIMLIPYGLKAAHDPTSIGARTIGMGNISVVGTSFHSLYNNQAALAYHQKMTAAIDYDQGFFVDKSLSIKSAGFTLPTGFGTLGLSMRYFGNSLYHEQKIGLAYGKGLGKYLAIGVQLDYFRTFIGNDYGSAQALSFEIGFYSKLSEDLEIGAHIFNPIGMKLSHNNVEKIPIAFKLGLLYHVSEDLVIAAETEKVLDQKTSYKIGLEYLISKHFQLRTGIASQPILYTFGMGLLWNQWILDIGTGYHQTLGFTPRVSLQFNFN